jgi:hypothetical protein
MKSPDGSSTTSGNSTTTSFRIAEPECLTNSLRVQRVSSTDRLLRLNPRTWIPLAIHCQFSASSTPIDVRSSTTRVTAGMPFYKSSLCCFSYVTHATSLAVNRVRSTVLFSSRQQSICFWGESEMGSSNSFLHKM